jgi:hypothetical protein
MKMFYISGIGSQETSVTYQEIKKMYPDVIYINYNLDDYTNDEDLISDIRRKIISYNKGNSMFERFIIGNSFGGRIAYQLGDICYKMLLINPAFKLRNEYTNLVEKIELNEDFKNNHSAIITLLSDNDTVVDNDYTINQIIKNKLRGDYEMVHNNHWLSANYDIFEQIKRNKEILDNIL